jgi:hypothetical protein
MPRFDGTGPWGEGPMTGGGRGFCNPAGRRYAFGYGGGYGRGRGFRRGGPGFGWGRGYGRAFGRGGYFPGRDPGGGPVYGTPYPSDPVQEAAMLKTQANDMRNDLDEINRRIEELEKESSQ